jgi:predicted NUDIX family phosphoesterase
MTVEAAEERVLVVPRALAIARPWRGLLTDPLAMTELVQTIATHGRFESRSAMEVDPAYKQIIPYLVLRDGARWFLMRRTRAGADARLHDRYSIGVGGHLNPGDVDIEAGLRREWVEELAADFEPKFSPIGLLNDDATPVGSVHLGVVYLADAGGRTVRIRETDKLAGEFADSSAAAAARDRMESWSQLAFDALA